MALVISAEQYTDRFTNLAGPVDVGPVPAVASGQIPVPVVSGGVSGTALYPSTTLFPSTVLYPQG